MNDEIYKFRISWYMHTSWYIRIN